MSNSHDQHEAHTGPIKTPKQLVWASIAAFVIPVFIIIGLVAYVSSANKEAPGASDSERRESKRQNRVRLDTLDEYLQERKRSAKRSDQKEETK